MVLAGLLNLAVLGLETEGAVDADALLNESYAPPLPAAAVLAVMGSLTSVLLLLLLLDAAPSERCVFR